MIMTTRADLFGKLVSELKKFSKYILVFSEFVVFYVFCQLSSMHSYHKKVNISNNYVCFELYLRVQKHYHDNDNLNVLLKNNMNLYAFNVND
jgi:hypothetical protein